MLDAAPAALGTDPAATVVLGAIQRTLRVRVRVPAHAAAASAAGFSQGATVGWGLAVAPWPRGDLVAAACLLSGRLLPDYGRDGAPLAGLAARAPPEALRARRTPILAAHGRMDGTTPVAMARESVRLARELLGDGAGDADAGRVRYTEHASAHDIPPRVLAAAADFVRCQLSASSC